jgi:hypothetical protein
MSLACHGEEGTICALYFNKQLKRVWRFVTLMIRITEDERSVAREAL